MQKLLTLIATVTLGVMLTTSTVLAVSVCGEKGGSCKPDGEYCPKDTTTVPDSSCSESFQACCNSERNYNDPSDAINPMEAPTNETFDSLNPLQIAGGETIEDDAPSEFAEQLSTPGGIISRFLEFVFPIAGLILFSMISWGGFEIITGAGDSSKVTAGKQRVTAAVAGFLLLFASYWMVQIMEVVFGVVIF